MLAAVVEQPGQLAVREVPMPIIDETECLVEILACGLCNSTDRKLLDGHFRYKGPDAYPGILGHEAVGRVIECGAAVESFKEGDLVLRPGASYPELFILSNKGKPESRRNSFLHHIEAASARFSGMTQCVEQLDFGFLLGKQICARFDGGELSSDGGVMLLSEADRRLGLTAALAACVPDPRDQTQIVHDWRTLFGQRVYQIACGYEDADDADDLRGDWAFKTALGRRPESDRDLASQPTFSRFENCVSRTALRRMAEVFVNQFVTRYATRRKCRIILDFDATDDETHGQQQFAAFHGYYKEHCYLPLIVTAQVDDGPQELLVTMLRPGNVDAAAYALSILKRLVPRLRQACPKARFLFRADGGFARPELYDWCEDKANRVDYEINLPQNSVLQQLAAPHLAAVHASYEATGEWQRRYAEAQYRAKDWPQPRRVVIKAEVTVKDNGATRDNPRFVLTNLNVGQAQTIYEHYGDRGEMENRIKELKNQLQMDRTSCHRFVANQLRVWLHAAAYLLHCELRRQLHGTALAAAQVATLQRKLLKVAVRIHETARRIWLHFASSYPQRELWPLLVERLRAAPT